MANQEVEYQNLKIYSKANDAIQKALNDILEKIGKRKVAEALGADEDEDIVKDNSSPEVSIVFIKREEVEKDTATDNDKEPSSVDEGEENKDEL